MKRNWPFWKIVTVNSIWQIAVIAIMLSAAHWITDDGQPSELQVAVAPIEAAAPGSLPDADQPHTPDQGAPTSKKNSAGMDFVDFSFLRPQG